MATAGHDQYMLHFFAGPSCTQTSATIGLPYVRPSFALDGCDKALLRQFYVSILLLSPFICRDHTSSLRCTTRHGPVSACRRLLLPIWRITGKYGFEHGAEPVLPSCLQPSMIRCILRSVLTIQFKDTSTSLQRGPNCTIVRVLEALSPLPCARS